MSLAMSQFNAFLETDLGAAFIAEEQALINHYLHHFIGYNLLQLSVQKDVQMALNASIGQYVQLGYTPDLRPEAIDLNPEAIDLNPETTDALRADYQHLPLANNCIDNVILHHVCEFSSDPHQLLREADRTLREGGYLAIIGLNPLSSWSLYRRWATPALPEHHPIRPARLADWLSVLNYDVLHQSCFFHRPAINHFDTLEQLQFFEPMGRFCRSPFGQLHFFLAKKRATPVSPLRSSWVHRVSSVRGARVKYSQPQRAVNTAFFRQ